MSAGSRGERSGVRVVEYAAAGSGIAAAYAGWLLARIGAQVTRLVGPGHDDDPPESPIRLALAALAEGKSSKPCPASPQAFAAALEDCDVFISDLPSALDALCGSPAALVERHPRLVAGFATTFGLDGPYADVPGTALDAQALASVAWVLGEPGREPLTLPPGIIEHQSGAMLAAGTMLALDVRESRGTGRIVDIALADVLASYVAGNCRFFVHHGLEWRRSGRRASGSGGAYPYVILPCKDGEVCICGRTRDEWNRLVSVMGNPAWANEPRYQDLRAMGREYPEEVDRLMQPWLDGHSRAELGALALEHNLIVAPIREIHDVLATPGFAERGAFEKARVAGRTLQVPALPFKVLESRCASARDLAPALLDGRDPAPSREPAAPPLDGLRILDFSWVWSAPWVGTMLAELGAEVIKVEHAGRPDNLRLAGRVFRDGQRVEGPSKEMSPMYHQVNHGKLGITLNAKMPRAVELLKRLASVSDVVVENMSPGSMERMGLGYDALRADNARLVMLAMSAAGQFGSLATMRAYAPTMSSFVGMEGLVGYPGEAPIGALNFGLSDPSASAHALVPLLAALRRARITGRGCYIDFSQVEALLGTLRPYLLDAQVHGRQPRTTGNRHPELAPHGVYPAAGDDAWLALAVADDAGWQTLCALAPDEPWARDPRFGYLPGRLAHVGELDAAIATWTAGHPRDALVRRLRDAGLGASPVLGIEEQWRNPHYAARGIAHSVEIPFYGEAALFQAPWRFSDLTPRVARCGPSTGEHNDYVFGELLGLSAQERAELAESGVIA